MLIFTIGFLIWCGCTFLSEADDFIELSYKVSCMRVYLKDISNSQDLMQLCDNKNCTKYFEDKIERDLKGFEECKTIK
jgi:hypothetical protein